MRPGPFEIVLASLFLYRYVLFASLPLHGHLHDRGERLMGSAAFTGILVLVLTTPLNQIVSKSSIHVQKGLSTARDKRMSVVNELISAVRHTAVIA